MRNPTYQIDLLTALGMSLEEKTGKVHYTSTHIRILYHLYNMGKRYQEIFPSTENIAKCLGIHHDTVSKFVNSPKFKEFGGKTRRCFTSNVYSLEGWVVECFRSLERLGFMKYFRQDFNKWRRLWKFRMASFYVNKLMNISTWSDLFESKEFRNNLSTNSNDKTGIEERDQTGTTSPSGGSYEVLRKTNDENARLGVQQSNEVASLLSQRLNLSSSDIHQFLFKNSLRIVRKAALILIYRIEIRKWKPKSRVKSLQSIINELKKVA